MSGIFKGDSIYKSGGGSGGGYKDGGELVDGDFIKVENNTVSSYDNVSRDPVNFYFEVNDGEILNSVVELTTAVNATINVYVVKNGLYYLLGNVGGDTVTAGTDYNLNVVGNSFVLEPVTPSPAYPKYITLGSNIYSLVGINGILWAAENLKEDITGTYVIRDSHIAGHNNEYYYKINQHQKIDDFLRTKNCRLPSYNDFNNLVTFAGGWNTTAGKKLRSTWGWYDTQGTDDYGFNALPVSTTSGGSVVNYIAMRTEFLGTNRTMTIDYTNSLGSGSNMGLDEYISVRFIVDLN